MRTSHIGYSTDYKLCYSSDIQTLFGMMRKNGFDEKSSEVTTLLNTLSMTMKKWKTPTGFYYVLKYSKNVFQPMYSGESGCVSSQAPACVSAADHSAEAIIQGRGLFRSLVIDRNGNIVSYSPAKTLRCNDTADFNALYDMKRDDFFKSFSHIEEFVEGTMIHLFRAPASNSSSALADANADELAKTGWEISTKGVVGGELFVPAPTADTTTTTAVKETGPTSAHKVTFRTLFFEACAANKIDLSTLDTRYSYSLVLQHPKNPMIAPIIAASLYYIAAYTINNDTLTVTRYPRNVIDHKAFGFSVPRNYDMDLGVNDPAFFQIHAKYAGSGGTTPYRVMGIVFHAAKNAGWSFKLRNPAYEAAKKIPMGPQTRMFYMYCSLRRTREIKKHLAVFPEDTAAFNEYNNSFTSFANLLHSKYIECFVLKQKTLGAYSSNIKNILHGLHTDIYLDRKNETVAATARGEEVPYKIKITYNDVMHYITNIVSPLDIFTSINWAKQQQQQQPATTA
jgi:hypothetical protein